VDRAEIVGIFTARILTTDAAISPRSAAGIWSGDESRRGAVAVLVALMLVVIIGFVSLGSEVVLLLLTSRQMQSAADAAALGAVSAELSGSPSDYTHEAFALAAAAGFANGQNGTTVTINSPPATGNYQGSTGTVEVLIAQPQTLALAKVVYPGPFTIRARTVAMTKGAVDCILELDSSSTTGVSVTNGAVVNLNQCGLAVNATGSSAVLVDGGATLTTTSVSVGGLVSVTNGGEINGPDGTSIVGTNKIQTLQPAFANPYGNTPVPTGSGCKYGSLGPDKPLTLKHSPGLQTLNADGVYCGGLVMSNDAQVTMNSGVYIIKGGTFNIGGAVQLNGTGVTIVLTGSGSDYAIATIGNGATVNLTAPNTGSTAGLVFFQDPNAPKTGTDDFEGGSTVALTGALYFPSQTVIYSNGTSSTSLCTQLIAWHVQFQGGASFSSNCANTGVGSIGGGGQPVMVE
jgi:Putative Flp pilus-assembly TadE/G-like